jgi:hypothetical protein
MSPIDRRLAVGFLALGLLPSILAPKAPAQAQFSGPTNYPVGSLPLGVAVGDFNGDGKQDLAVVNTGDQTVSILLGDGDGTFQPAVNYPVPGAPGLLAVGDFNGDGKLDLAVANGSVVSILLGNGDGTFQANVDYNAGGQTTSVYVADFNNDGKPDLLTPDIQDGTISVLPGNGDGTFQTPIVTAAQGAAPYVAIGDFNGDGRLDVATAAASSTTQGILIILLGNGDGTFAPGLTSPLPATTFSVEALATADFNGDGKTDLVVTYFYIDSCINPTTGHGVPCPSKGTGTVLGNGDGTFGSVYTIDRNKPWGGTLPPIDVMALDLNNDGNADVMTMDMNVYSPLPFAIGWMLGNGADYFPAFSFFVLGSTPASWLAAGDFNGDTLSDLVETNRSANSISLFLNSTPSVTLTLTVAGNGNGTVNSQPAVMKCKNSCIGNFAPGTAVTLTATPNATSNFTAWAGACSGTGSCSVTMKAATSVTATFTLQDFSLSPASTKLTLQPGGQGSDVLTIAGLNGQFTNAIQLSCEFTTGPAPLPTCGLSANSVTPGSSSVTSTLTITAPANAAAMQPPLSHRQSMLFYALWLPFMFGITVVGGSRKLRRGCWAAAGAFLLLLFLETACGGGNSSNGGGGIPAATNYTVTITGTSGAIQQTSQVTVTVQ